MEDRQTEINGSEKNSRVRLLELLTEERWNHGGICKIVPEWERLTGEGGYAHNQEKVGDHTQTVVRETRKLLEIANVSPAAKEAGILAAFWHDFGKPTGKRGEDVRRDFHHDEKSIEMMRERAAAMGMAEKDIQMIERVIACDGIVSDIVRGQARNQNKNIGPAQLAGKLGGDIETCRVLRAMNQADVIATVGEEGWQRIEEKFNTFFDRTEKVILGQMETGEMSHRVQEVFDQGDRENGPDGLKKLWLDAMEVVDRVRCLPFLGAKDAKTMAGFSRLMREEGEPFDIDRWLGVHHFVDKGARRNFLDLVKSHNPEVIRKLIRAAGSLDANRVFTWGFFGQSLDIDELANNPDLLELGSRLGKTRVFDHVWRGHGSQKSLKNLLEIVKGSQLDGKLLTDRELLEKLHENSGIFHEEDLGPILTLENFPLVLDYVRSSEKKIRSDMIPLLEFASMDPTIFAAVKAYIEEGSDESKSININIIRIVQKLAGESDNHLVQKLGSLAGGELDQVTNDWDRHFAERDYYKARAQGIFQTMASLAAQIGERSLSKEAAESYLESFPVESWNFAKLGWVVRGGRELLEKLGNTEWAGNFAAGKERHGELNFLVAKLALKLEEEQKISFAEAMVLAEGLFPSREMVAKINKVMWSHVGGYLNTRPGKIAEMVELLSEEPVVHALLPGGVLGDSVGAFGRAICQTDNPYERGMEIVEQFNKPSATFWERAYFFALGANPQVLKNQTRFARTRYVGINEKGEFIKWGDFSPEEKINRGADGEDVMVDIKLLSWEQKKGALMATLAEAVEGTRSKGEKQRADLRNRELARTNQLGTAGVRLHGTELQAIPRILRSGNLSGECLIKRNTVDSYPFCVDFAVINKKEAKMDFPGAYFSKGVLYGSYFGQGVVLIYTPSDEVISTAKGTDHVLKFAGETATNITGMILTRGETDIEEVKMEIAENGFYIPIYDTQGKLLFAESEYDELRRDYHLDRDLEYWEGSLRTGDALGSNPGGTYLIPEPEGPTRYYVKQPGNRDWVWSEWLANRLYADFGAAVPRAEVRNVDGRLGITTRWIGGIEDVDGSPGPLKDAALVDAWLGNWDIPFARERNVIEVAGGVVRLDNGGAGLFRARGELKDFEGGASPFTAEVVELENERGGIRGMMRLYSGLTDEDLRQQGVKLREVFTDQVIDERVEQTQIAPKLRELLKKRLKERRDNIVSRLGLDKEPK